MLAGKMAQKKPLNYIGIVLRKYRKKAKLTQKRLASKMGISVDYIGRLERQTRHPSIEMLIAFADIFDITPGELLDAIVEMEKENKNNSSLPQHDEDI